MNDGLTQRERDLKAKVEAVERDLAYAKEELASAIAFRQRESEYRSRRVVVMVPSDGTPGKFYQVDPRGGEFACQCFDHLYRAGPNHTCKHVRKAQQLLAQG